MGRISAGASRVVCLHRPPRARPATSGIPHSKAQRNGRNVRGGHGSPISESRPRYVRAEKAATPNARCKRAAVLWPRAKSSYCKGFHQRGDSHRASPAGAVPTVRPWGRQILQPNWHCGDCCVHRWITAAAGPIYRSGGVAAARTRSSRAGVCISRRHRAPRNQAGLNVCSPGTTATAAPSRLCVGSASPTASCERPSAQLYASSRRLSPGSGRRYTPLAAGKFIPRTSAED